MADVGRDLLEASHDRLRGLCRPAKLGSRLRETPVTTAALPERPNIDRGILDEPLEVAVHGRGAVLCGKRARLFQVDVTDGYLTLTGALSFAASLTVLVGGIYWKRANVRGAYWAFLGSAVPPIACLAIPAIDPTYAGLLSFLLAPAGLLAGSLTSTKRSCPAGTGTAD